MTQVITRTEARQAGLRRYCTGKPCKRGHICERLVSTFQCLNCVRPQVRRWQRDNPQVKRAQNEKYKDRRAATKRRWNIKNRRHVADYARRRRQESPQVLIADRLRTRLWKALRGQSKDSGLVELLGVSLADAVVYIERLFRPGMTWANYGKWHLDHKRALSTFNLVDPGELALAAHISNLQPLWAVDNLRKGAR